MTYNALFPPDGANVSLTPAYIKEKAEQLRTERIVDAGFFMGKPVEDFAMKTDVPVITALSPSMITQDAGNRFFTDTERAKLATLGGANSSKILYTVSGTYNVNKTGTILLSAVAGGGGGSSCLGCGGGSGQSTSRTINVTVMDTITITIGHGGAGNVNYANNVGLPSSGTVYAGGNGGNTVITITRLMGGGTETITLTGGTGGNCISPSSVQYSPGLGENNGGVMAMNMFSSGNSYTYWNGGNGGASIFGAGGIGGTITYGDYSKADAGDGLSYGAGGGGGGFRQASGYSWTCGGDGMQGCVVLEVQ